MKTIKEYVNLVENDYSFFEYQALIGNETHYELFDCLSYFEGDPDYLKIDGESCYFIELSGIVYYYPFCDDKKALKALRRFYEGKLNRIEPNTWEKWETIKNGLAYRGGSGYLYTLYKL